MIFCILTTTTLLITWVGVDVNVKTFTMESKTTTIRSRRSRTHLTCAKNIDPKIILTHFHLSWKFKFDDNLLFEVVPNTDLVSWIPREEMYSLKSKKSPNFRFWVCTISGKIQRQILPTPWVLTTSNHGQIVAAEEHFKISKSSTSSIAPVLWLFDYIPWQYSFWSVVTMTFLLLLIILWICCFLFVILSNHLSLLFP